MEHYNEVILTNLLDLAEFQLEAYNRVLKWAMDVKWLNYQMISCTIWLCPLSKQWAGKQTVVPNGLLGTVSVDFPVLPALAQEMLKVFCSKPAGEPHATSLTDSKKTPHLKKQVTIASITPQPMPQRKSRCSKRTTGPISVSRLNDTSEIIQHDNDNNIAVADASPQPQQVPRLCLNTSPKNVETREVGMTVSGPLLSPGLLDQSAMEESESNTMSINPPSATTMHVIKANNINTAAFDSPAVFLQSPPSPDLNMNPRKTSDVITPRLWQAG